MNNTAQNITLLLAVVAVAIAGYFYIFADRVQRYVINDTLNRKLTEATGTLASSYTDSINEDTKNDFWIGVDRYINDGVTGDESVEQTNANFELVRGFFKGIDVFPMHWNVYLLQEDIKEYLSTNPTRTFKNITVGEFLPKT